LRNQCRWKWKLNGATLREKSIKARSNWFLGGIRFSWEARTFSLALSSIKQCDENQGFNTTFCSIRTRIPSSVCFALWYFTGLMIIWNVVGHTVLGFEQSWATPITAITTAVVVSMFLDWVDARARNRELALYGKSWEIF